MDSDPPMPLAWGVRAGEVTAEVYALERRIEALEYEGEILRGRVRAAALALEQEVAVRFGTGETGILLVQTLADSGLFRDAHLELIQVVLRELQFAVRVASQWR